MIRQWCIYGHVRSFREKILIKSKQMIIMSDKRDYNNIKELRLRV